MTHARHWLRSVLLSLLALALLSGGSLAAGDLFDDEYADCPHRTRMRDGEIADLTVARDAEEADEVNVAWAATDPATWGLGPNAYSTRLVVILDDQDGAPVTKTLSLGTRKVTFEGVETGTEVKVQLAVVVDTAGGDYLISDILEASVNQSLSAPSFSTDWIIKGTHDCYGTRFPQYVDIPFPELGALYYLGYNENFANYRAGTAVYNHRPSTPRFRIGLAHGGEDDDARDNVKFDTYLLRLVDEDGDVIPEGDDVPMTMSSYGQEHYAPFRPTPECPPGLYDRAIVLDLNYGITGLTNDLNTRAAVSGEPGGARTGVQCPHQRRRDHFQTDVPTSRSVLLVFGEWGAQRRRPSVGQDCGPRGWDRGLRQGVCAPAGSVSGFPDRHPDLGPDLHPRGLGRQ